MAIGMKLQAMALVGLFLPIAILAAPSADPASAPADKAPKKAARPVVGDTSPEAIGLTKRTNVNCYIVNVDNYANCRSGPGTGYDITGAVYEGDLYTFQCYEPGECFDGNCTWDRIYDSNGGYCYVNGYFTDDNCTPANLGLC